MTGNTRAIREILENRKHRKHREHGNIGSVGWFISDRVDLPFVTRPDPAGGPKELGDLRRAQPANFGSRQWSANWYAWRVLHQMMAMSPAGRRLIDGDTALTNIRTGLVAGYSTQIDILVLAARDERPEAMGAILSRTLNSSRISWPC